MIKTNKTTTIFEDKIIEAMEEMIVKSMSLSGLVNIRELRQEYAKGCERCRLLKSCESCAVNGFMGQVTKCCDLLVEVDTPK